MIHIFILVSCCQSVFFSFEIKIFSKQQLHYFNGYIKTVINGYSGQKRGYAKC